MNEESNTGLDPVTDQTESHSAPEPDLRALDEARKLIPTNPTLAIEKLAELERMGSTLSLVYLGIIYYSGRFAKKDLQKAERYWSLANKNKSVHGTYNLGLLYFKQKDMTKAKMLFENCVNENFAPAMHRLGIMYYNGYGVRKNKMIAMRLWEKSAAFGNILANGSLGFAYMKFDGGISNFLKSFGMIRSAISRFAELKAKDPSSDLIK